MVRMTVTVIALALLMIVGISLFNACDETNEKQNVTDDLTSPLDAAIGGEENLLHLSPLPVVDPPPDIRTASREAALDWAMNLTTDDLQRYGIVGVRGADPRRDVPEKYPDRDEVIEHLFLIGLWANGVESAGDQTEWIRAHENHEQGGIAFAMADRNGPDWGWYVPPSSSLDIYCEPPVVQKFYYLWRTNGSSEGAVLSWSSPDAGESNRRIPISSYVRTSNTPGGSALCTMSITYKSATEQDGRFMVGQNEEDNLDGYFRGTGALSGENVRPQGLPYWSRTVHESCISTNPSCDDIINPGNINTSPKYLNAGYAAFRHRDYFATTNTAGAGDDDSCWWYQDYDSFVDENGHCCSPVFPDLADSCFWTTGTHQGAEWNHADYPADGENYFYNSSASNTGDLIRQNVEYLPSAFVTDAAGNYTRGGWMNQVVFQSPIDPVFYSELANDGVKTPAGSFDAAGNSQSIHIYISINDSAQWLNRKLKIGCRPFWKWNFRRGADVLPYYLQLGTAGTVNCNAGGYSEYNNWNISSGNNPLYCTLGDDLWAACVTWDAGYPLDHPPWKQGAGFLYPSITCVRQLPGIDNATYYPMKSTLARETDDNDPDYYAGTYLTVRYSNRTQED